MYSKFFQYSPVFKASLDHTCKIEFSFRTNVSERGGMLTPGSLSVSSSSPSSMLQDRRRPSSTCDPNTALHIARTRSASDDESQNDGLLAPATLTAKSRSSEDGLLLPPPCTCPYFGTDSTPPRRTTEVIIVPGGDINNCNGFPARNGNFKTEETPTSTPFPRRSSRGAASMVTWEEARRFRRGSSFGGARTTLSTPTRNIRTRRSMNARQPVAASPQRTPRIHHSRNSSVISRNSSRHGRILRLEQKATKVLGVVFFTFVVLWAPFFILNMVPAVCAECEQRIANWVFDFVLWLGYASSMVNPIFYTIFNKVFRQAFKKVLKCQYCKSSR